MGETAIPSAVTDAAGQRQFGRPIVAQQAPARRTDLIRVLAFFGVVALLAGAGLYWASMTTGTGILGFFALVTLALGVILLIYAARTVAQRGQSYFLYAGGLVYQRGKPQAIAWQEIAALHRRRVDVEKMAKVGMTPEALGVRPDSVIGYDVALRSGGRIFLKVGNVAEDQARFCATLEQLGGQAGIRISG